MKLLMEQERICRDLGNNDRRGASLMGQALILRDRGDFDGAMNLFKEQEGIWRELGNKNRLSISLDMQVVMLKACGDLDDAMKLLREQESICRELGNKDGMQASLASTIEEQKQSLLRLIADLMVDVTLLREGMIDLAIRSAAPQLSRLFPRVSFIVEELWKILPRARACVRAALTLEEVLMHFVPSIAFDIWRLRRRMIDPATLHSASPQPLEPFDQVYHYIESLWKALGRAGVEVHDYDGEAYDPRVAWRVGVVGAKAGISRQQVEITIEPSVFYNGRMIHLGKVIVATPRQIPPAQGL
jgi:hypothetical protein